MGQIEGGCFSGERERERERERNDREGQHGGLERGKASVRKTRGKKRERES